MLKKILMVLVSLIIIGTIAVGILVGMPNKEEVDPITYFSEFTPGQLNLVFEDRRIDSIEPVIEIEGVSYLSQEFAKQYIDDAIFYDTSEGVLTITTVNEVIRMARGSNEVSVNGKISQMQEALLEKGGIAYISENYLEARYNFDITKGVDGRLYKASDLGVAKQTAVVNARNSELRTHPDHKMPIIDKVKKDHEIIVYSVENGYARVRDENGIIGFIKEDDIKIVGETEVVADKKYEPLPSKNPLNEKVKLVWDQLTVRTAGNWNSTKYTQIKGANVISPTWFEFEDAEGNLIDKGSKEYVDRAHSKGLQVWGLMSHNFTEPQLTKIILTSTSRRQHVINQLLGYAEVYNLDGINIDIENIQPEFSQEWVQFMRELYPQAKAKGLTVSVDVYMPSAWSGHYERSKIAEVVDYFIVMAYDEHWSGSEQAGPVASLPWVSQGLQATLEDVPNEKLVLGMPTFSRMWAETSAGLETRAYGMEEVRRRMNELGIETVPDEYTGQLYGEKVVDNKRYKVWLEDAPTIAKRVEMIDQYDLEGYAIWRLGLETPDVWDELDKVK